MKHILPCIFLWAIAVATFAQDFKLHKYEVAPKTFSSISIVFDKYPKTLVDKTLRDFIRQTRPSRMMGKIGHDKARDFILSEIKKADIGGSGAVMVDEFIPPVAPAQEMFQSDFNNEIVGKYESTDPVFIQWATYTSSMVRALDTVKNIKGHNIIWEKKGLKQDDEVLLVAAGYDTISIDNKTLAVSTNAAMPGADNNGSGVSVALNLIRVLSVMELPRTVRVVFLDGEELGFLGTRAYVKKYLEDEGTKDGRKLAGVVYAFMLGHDSKREDKSKKNGNMKMYIRKIGEDGIKEDRRLAEKIFLAGERISPMAHFEIVENSFNSAGHILFWQKGIPAVAMTQNWEDDYNLDKNHTPGDIVETINMRTLQGAFQYLGAAVVAWSFGIEK